MFRGPRFIAITIAASAAAAAAVASVASGGSTAAGYNTTQAPMVTLLADAPTNSSADAIISVGDTMPAGYTFESLPDGVSVYPRGNGRADVFVNHETSTVPFPYSSPFGGATPEANQNDYTNSEVSQLNFNQKSGAITSASKAIATVGTSSASARISLHRRSRASRSRSSSRTKRHRTGSIAPGPRGPALRPSRPARWALSRQASSSRMT